MCFASVKLTIVLTTFVPLFTLNWYNNNYNNNTNVLLALHTQLVIRLLEFQLTPARFVLHICICTASVRRTFSMWNVHYLFLQNSIAKACVCAFSNLSVPHACCYWLIWKMFDTFVYTLTPVDVIGSLLRKSSRHLPMLVYLCNKSVLVVTIAFDYCSVC